MSGTTDHGGTPAIGVSHRDPSGGGLPAARRRPWAPPRVILSAMGEARINIGGVDDGDPGGYPANAPS